MYGCVGWMGLGCGVRGAGCGMEGGAAALVQPAAGWCIWGTARAGRRCILVAHALQHLQGQAWPARLQVLG